MNRRSFIQNLSTAVATLAYLPLLKSEPAPLETVHNRDWRVIGDPDPDALFELFRGDPITIYDKGIVQTLLFRDEWHLRRTGKAQPGGSFGVQRVDQLFSTPGLIEVFKIPPRVGRLLPPWKIGEGKVWRVTRDHLAIERDSATHIVEWVFGRHWEVPDEFITVGKLDWKARRALEYL